MAKIDVQKIFEQVKENHKRLDNCSKPHDFSLMETETTNPARKRFVCLKCMGTVDAINHAWYEKGLDDGRGQC